MPVIAIAEIFGINGRGSELVTQTERPVRALLGSRRLLGDEQPEAGSQRRARPTRRGLTATGRFSVRRSHGLLS